MGGRTAHGRAPNARPLGKAAAKAKARKSKPKPLARAKARAQDAYQIASDLLPQVEKRTPRNRQLDPETGHKHGREDDDDVDGGPRRKRVRGGRKADEDSDVEYGSDEEGNQWRLGGPIGEEDDSEIDSDNAFGESDEENLTLRKNKSRKGQDSGSDEDGEEEEEDDESLGEDAVDLATALDLAEAESSEEEEAESGSDEESGSSTSESDSDTDMEDASEDLKDVMLKYGAKEADNEPGKPKKKDFAVLDDDEDEETAQSTKPKIDLADLDLGGLMDPHMRTALKVMTKEEKASRPGTKKKLDIPLVKRLQDRIDRKTAFEKTTETLDRWTETIKHNRRADHLIFPLPQQEPTASMGNAEFQPLKPSNPNSELERTMFSLLEQSGLSLNKEPKKKPEPAGPDLQLSKDIIKKHNEELVKQRRREREMQSREAKKAARLKKIKSKAFHRVHRKQKLKDMQDDDEEMDSMDEKEAQDRRRALERVGARHKNSAWAKSGSKVKRAVWDDDYRAGLTEMARRDQELRRRAEGRTGSGSDSEDEGSESESDSEAEKDRLLRKLDDLEADDEGKPHGKSALFDMPFMQRAEEQIKKSNDEMIKQIRRDLNSGSEQESEEEVPVVGRKTYGPASKSALVAAKAKSALKKNQSIVPEAEKADEDAEIIIQDAAEEENSGTWIKGKPRKAASRVHELNIMTSEPNPEEEAPPPEPKPSSHKAAARSAPAPPRTREPEPTPATNATTPFAENSDDASEAEPETALNVSDKLILEAFGGDDDIEDEFQREKEALAEEQDDQIVDNTLPGWGSWVGEGVSARERKKHVGRFTQTVEGVNKKKRQDAKLKKVIINEKRIKKNDKYKAPGLPHPFETREQYERSLRMPVGKEWVTKETFQEQTKPRVIVKQGIINPMSRPLL